MLNPGATVNGAHEVSQDGSFITYITTSHSLTSTGLSIGGLSAFKVGNTYAVKAYDLQTQQTTTLVTGLKGSLQRASDGNIYFYPEKTNSTQTAHGIYKIVKDAGTGVISATLLSSVGSGVKLQFGVIPL